MQLGKLLELLDRVGCRGARAPRARAPGPIPPGTPASFRLARPSSRPGGGLRDSRRRSQSPKLRRRGPSHEAVLASVSPSGLGRRLGGVESVEGFNHVLRGDPFEGERHTAVTANGGDERTCPAVLVDEHDRRATGLDRFRGFRCVLVAEQARRGAFEDGEVADPLVAEVPASKPENVPSSFFVTNMTSSTRMISRLTRSSSSGIASPVMGASAG